MNFLNFEDPEVLEKLTGPDYDKYWKATYGLDYVKKLPSNSMKFDQNAQDYDIDLTTVAVHCVESEFRYDIEVVY